MNPMTGWTLLSAPAALAEWHWHLTHHTVEPRCSPTVLIYLCLSYPNLCHPQDRVPFVPHFQLPKTILRSVARAEQFTCNHSHQSPRTVYEAVASPYSLLLRAPEIPIQYPNLLFVAAPYDPRQPIQVFNKRRLTLQPSFYSTTSIYNQRQHRSLDLPR